MIGPTPAAAAGASMSSLEALLVSAALLVVLLSGAWICEARDRTRGIGHWCRPGPKSVCQ